MHFFVQRIAKRIKYLSQKLLQFEKKFNLNLGDNIDYQSFTRTRYFTIKTCFSYGQSPFALRGRTISTGFGFPHLAIGQNAGRCIARHRCCNHEILWHRTILYFLARNGRESYCIGLEWFKYSNKYAWNRRFIPVAFEHGK
jgi:hypothetical protein